ncbi:MAG: class I poly(R)-hydroxyalkanoic acid synthase [Hoeflea sp.]|uniref:class I poly(R)-hydroxyalkanoic acid synthase n=1 Tax=Hoeflea sp. TaxID=1940281 RepID=UPI001D4177D3|nr:class I poly(R)-hydroxyalkanoic acid synthase [Hoeflea sp.]MBU4530686.1 class I poly(R)-hydroxyalkanoic acid synthase [Alphaproteobacteria bacterium]MBU4544906.1 class I poly(R)-hydroxyalkanoic acid synthase [Alphaproteobacteria bacterium]MBU4552049.1 class I poly(R)-hydroxyalkanoic acid synthase [Alphaproteobacteria bacterium]MBV1722238.1 class I poly(R)-hydroxyalkanoic acid synthase [Hoeflea sp.]MBV1761800.1 class I poly(R)-hydroxyalkanoic acid synthase [Hoeflea sp.]
MQDKGNSTAGKDPIGDKASLAEAYVVKDPEVFARNVARMLEELGKAASAWVEPRERGEVSDTVSEPMTDMVKTFSKVGEYWLSDPKRAIEAQTSLLTGYFGMWSDSLKRMSGEDDTPKKKNTDKRFSDPDWDNNPFFEFLKNAYFITSDWANKLVAESEGLDEHTRHKAAFYMRQVTSALSPANFLATNPELYKETVASNGENLVRGMHMLAEDIAAGKGELKLRQSDASNFKVGENIAVSPGKVIAQDDICQIIQYEPKTENVLKRPLLIVPPWINKFYILDLNPKKSFIKWAVEQGHTVFVISWVNPDQRHAKKDWEAYSREGISFALDTIEQATGEREVNAIGYCVGGTLLAATLALHAQEKDTRIASATFFTTQTDFTHAGDLKVFVDEAQIASIEHAMEKNGYLDGSKMATAFNMLRASDLIWPYVVNNYLKGKDPMPFDLLYWNSDATRMPAANHSFYLRNCYLENNLSQGKMKLAGKTLKLGKVKTPIYNLAAKEDHIAPARSAYVGGQLFGGEVTYVMAGSGHIAGVINPPEAGKYQFWSDGPKGAEFDDWVKGAKETPGSWWPHWHEWIKSHSSDEVPARQPGGSKLNAIEDAPGSYVRTRV